MDHFCCPYGSNIFMLYLAYTPRFARLPPSVSRLLELRKSCIFVHGHVRSRSWCPLQVSPQDWCALVGGNLLESDFLKAPAPDNRPSTGGAYVMDPLHVLSEHRHQVPLSIDDDHDQRQRDSPSRLASGYFQCDKIVGGDARRRHSRPQLYSKSSLSSWVAAHGTANE